MVHAGRPRRRPAVDSGDGGTDRKGAHKWFIRNRPAVDLRAIDGGDVQIAANAVTWRPQSWVNGLAAIDRVWDQAVGDVGALDRRGKRPERFVPVMSGFWWLLLALLVVFIVFIAFAAAGCGTGRGRGGCCGPPSCSSSSSSSSRCCPSSSSSSSSRCCPSSSSSSSSSPCCSPRRC